MSTGRKLAVGGALVVGVAAYMVYLGASESWQYYLTVDECLAAAGQLPGQPVRVSGKVHPGTLHVAADRRRAEFALQGTGASLPVVCSTSLPDNLAEGMDVVVEGRLDETGTLQGRKLLTRCAAKYAAKSQGLGARG